MAGNVTGGAADKVRRPVFQIIELLFDGGYLLFALVAGVVFAALSARHAALPLYAAMTLVLAVGDAFHLIPRMAKIAKGTAFAHHNALNRGKQITSITMTVFYVLLLAVWKKLYPSLTISVWLEVLYYALAAVRIVLCLGKKQWGADTTRASVVRNTPFLAMGGIAMYAFIRSAVYVADGFSGLYLAVLFSFAFYIPVALLSKKIPPIGALMLPKTAMYIWMVAAGFSLL